MKKDLSTQQRVKIILDELCRLYPDPIPVPLNFSNNWELLVAVILSAQCTDVMVNKVTNELFQKYSNLDNYIHVSREELEQDIKSTGFFRNKAKSIQKAAQVIQEAYAGELPPTMNELLEIPGVGKKTANVILGIAFGKVEGIVVDTHIKRLSLKFKLTTNKNPDKIESDLMEIIPRKEWWSFPNKLKKYGQDYSPARKKKDTDDPISLKLFDGGLS